MVYTLTITIEGKGSVTKEPDKDDYDDGEEVTLTAVPENEFWSFYEWSGDISGEEEEITITIDSDMEITATFILEVSVEQVRAALNDISEEELSDNTIIQKIYDGIYYADKKELEGYRREKFIRAYSALKSFIVSDTYSQVDFGDIRVRKEWDRILEELERDIEEVGFESLVIDDTHMFDERPSERLDDGDDELIENLW